MSSRPAARTPRRRSPGSRISAKRRRGLTRLAILLGSIVSIAIVGSKLAFDSGSGADSKGAAAPTEATRPAQVRLTATPSGSRLPVALHGEAMAPADRGLLVIGGADSGDVSTDSVYRLDPATGRVSAFGHLAQPLHDAAAVTLGGQTLVFGGGSTSTIDLVQALTPGGTARPVGRLPGALSDLSAVTVGGAAYVLGGYDGQTTFGSVLQTTKGRAFTTVARLPTPVRYAPAVALQDKIYVFGGELASGRDTNEIQEYDTATDRSVVAGRLPEPVSHASAVTLDGAIFLLGGRVQGFASDRILRFDPSRNVAVGAGRLPEPVFDGAAATYGRMAYLIGGLGSGGSALDSVIGLR